jgi:hypothetical protein
MTGRMIPAAMVISATVPLLVLRRRGHVAGPAALALFSLVTLVSLMLLPLAAACLAQSLLSGDRATSTAVVDRYGA